MMKTKDIAVMMGVALATLTACTSDSEGQTEERMPIRLTAAVQQAVTRAGSTTQDTKLLSGQSVAAYIKAGSEWLAQPLACTVSGTDGDLTAASTVYFPMDGTPVSIYAVHPSYTSDATFTVANDQTADADYAASDLTYSKTTAYTKAATTTLQFQHLLSKIIVNVETTMGDVSDLRLWARRSTTMTYPTGSSSDYELGTASAPDNILMTEGGAVIIPPQAVTTLGDIRIKFNVSGVGPIVYDFPVGTTFESNKQYTYTVLVQNIGVSVTSTVTDWGTKVAENVRARRKDIKLNPLWYVAEHNVNYTPATGTAWDSGAGTFSFAESDNEGYFFAWTDAMKYFTTTGNLSAGTPSSISDYTAGSGSRLSGWHLPVLKELQSIIPVTNAYLWDYDNGSGTYYTSITNLVFGYNSETKAGIDDHSYWRKINAKELHAIRFLGTPYCSAWRYRFDTMDGSDSWSNTNYGYLEISAILINNVIDDNATSVSTWYNNYFNSITWSNDENKGAQQRIFYALGVRTGTGESANSYPGTYGYWWNATEYNSSHVWSFVIVSDLRATIHWNYYKTDGRLIRLFRDN